MSWVYRNLIRPSLFAKDSEEIHEQTLQALGWISRHAPLQDLVRTFFESPKCPVHLWGYTFPNPVGLAAGMDKYAAALPCWEALGFGFTEIGGITKHPQEGNPAPRLFRLPLDQALINRMGFNNPGADAAAQRLGEWLSQGLYPSHPVGINVGKSKITPLTEAAQEYADVLETLWDFGDFFVLNVSSPNTPNLRALQEKGALLEILETVQEVNQSLARTRPSRLTYSTRAKPILIKIAPDLELEALDQILEVSENRIDGIVATNTTVTRPITERPDNALILTETGGLSGKPLAARSTALIRHIYQQTEGHLPIIGVGGIFNAADAWEKIRAGASLVQVYTGLIYEGPSIARSINNGLNDRVSEHGYRLIEEAKGKVVRSEETLKIEHSTAPAPLPP